MIRHKRNRQLEKREIIAEIALTAKEDNVETCWEDVVPMFVVVPSDKFEILYNGRSEVYINGFRIHGSFAGNCPECGHKIFYDYDHDDHFCPSCNEWSYSGCGDSGCRFCAKRPEKPLPDFGVNDTSFPERGF